MSHSKLVTRADIQKSSATVAGGPAPVTCLGKALPQLSVAPRIRLLMKERPNVQTVFIRVFAGGPWWCRGQSFGAVRSAAWV